ncbi:DNA ligase 1-like [Trichomycterus rosablanca]|uniref:DNA ligase 1-like n=1 Tax=Trichomycterus rosablanca TaxID=2290929 RepID=UPI002F35AF88
MRKWIQMIRKLFKRFKIHPPHKEKVEENEADVHLEEFADGSEKQKDWGEKQEHQQSTCSQEILLSLHRIFEKHAECSENLLREITKLTDVIESTKKTNSAEMESTAPLAVSQDVTPAQKPKLPFSTFSSFFSSARIRLPPIKELQHSCVESSVISSVHTDDVKPPQSPKLAWGANQCCMNTEEIMLTENTDLNVVELQTVDATSSEDETIGLMIGRIVNKPLDEQTHLLEMEFNAKLAEWSETEKEEKVKVKLEMDEANQRRQEEIEDLKLKVNFLKNEAKREKQEGKKKQKDLEKEMKNEKLKLLLELKELKKKLKMEKKEERNGKKMEKHMEVDEEEHEAKDKRALKSKFRVAFKFRGFKERN